MKDRDAMRPLGCDDVRELAGAFVLGALDPAEDAAVRSHLAGDHGAEHPEIAELGSVLPALLETVPVVEPPEGLKGRIMAAAAADLAARDDLAAGAEGAQPPVQPPAPTPFPTAEQREARRRTSTGDWLLRIAAVLAIAVLGGWNLLLQNQLGASQAYERNVAAVLEVATRPGSLTAVLAPDGDTGSGIAAVDAGGVMTMAMRDLAPTTGSSVYEAWVIAADGVPRPLGSFSVGSSGTGYLHVSGLPAAEGIVLALTREAGPDATTPTLPIISAGVASSPG